MQEIKWLESVLKTKHIKEQDKWVIEGRISKLKKEILELELREKLKSEESILRKKLYQLNKSKILRFLENLFYGIFNLFKTIGNIVLTFILKNANENKREKTEKTTKISSPRRI